jgi:hypothetical protein
MENWTWSPIFINWHPVDSELARRSTQFPSERAMREKVWEERSRFAQFKQVQGIGRSRHKHLKWRISGSWDAKWPEILWLSAWSGSSLLR